MRPGPIFAPQKAEEEEANSLASVRIRSHEHASEWPAQRGILPLPILLRKSEKEEANSLALAMKRLDRSF